MLVFITNLGKSTPIQFFSMIQYTEFLSAENNADNELYVMTILKLEHSSYLIFNIL